VVLSDFEGRALAVEPHIRIDQARNPHRLAGVEISNSAEEIHRDNAAGPEPADIRAIDRGADSGLAQRGTERSAARCGGNVRDVQPIRIVAVPESIRGDRPEELHRKLRAAFHFGLREFCDLRLHNGNGTGLLLQLVYFGTQRLNLGLHRSESFFNGLGVGGHSQYQKEY
jgi:hypothetical protein